MIGPPLSAWSIFVVLRSGEGSGACLLDSLEVWCGEKVFTLEHLIGEIV